MEYRNKAPAPTFLPWCLALAALAIGCARTEVKTPIRVLDRPTDVALFCADIEKAACPQQGSAERDAEFIERYCAFQGVPDVGQEPRAVKVLPLASCDSQHRQERTGELLAPLKEAIRREAERLSLDADATTSWLADPCCAPGHAGCGRSPPVCSRRRLYALVTNANRGEVAVVDTQTQVAGLNTVGEIQNLQSGRPGFGFLPVGLLPQHVRTFASATDAWAVTANAGSCDLSVLDLAEVAGLVAQPGSCSERSCPDRVIPWAGDGRQAVRARPAWVEPLPAASPERRVLVAYPGCALVAEVELSTMGAPPGEIKEALVFRDDGLARRVSGADLGSLRCPAECGGGAPLEMIDGLMPAPRASTYPASVAVDEEGQRILIGDALGDALTVLTYRADQPDGMRFGEPQRIPLDFVGSDGAPSERGVLLVRVAPRNAAGKFAYAIARDSTVRVVDLDAERECETNPDPRYLQAEFARFFIAPDEENESNLRRLSCLEVGPTPRSPFFTSPGIRLRAGALPRDVAFVHVGLPCDPGKSDCQYSASFDARETVGSVLPAHPSKWIGDFAWILASSGEIHGVQLADHCPQPSSRACLPDRAAVSRVDLLYTRSEALHRMSEPSNLPQAVQVSIADRLSNVVRNARARLGLSGHRAGASEPLGPWVRSDGSGAPVVTLIEDGQQVGAVGNVPGPGDPMGEGRRRLIRPTLATYPYSPFDPVCDVALAEPGKVPVDLEGRAQDGTRADLAPWERPPWRVQAVAAFPEPGVVRDGTFTLEWEGVLTSGRTGVLTADHSVVAIVDEGGLFCTHGVEPGDKVWIPGCRSDAECAGGVCVREQAQGNAPGLCLPSADPSLCRRESQRLVSDRPAREDQAVNWAASWVRRYRVLSARQRQPGAGTMSRLVLGEITEPEFALDHSRCDGRPMHAECDVGQHAYVQPAGALRPVVRATACRVDRDGLGQPVKRCVLECETSADCSAGFVCAHSVHEAEEPARPDGKPPRARCMRAPLPTPQVVSACFNQELRYEVRTGDAFLLRGSQSGAPVYERADPVNGECVRPRPGDRDFQAARLRQPRIRLGARDSLPAGSRELCSASRAGWISHRRMGAASAPSCASLLQDGMRGTVTLSSGLTLGVERASARRDLWIDLEADLFGVMPLSGPGSCVLTDQAAEALSGPAPCPGDPSEQAPCSRRIHYENPILNLVLQVPRRPEGPVPAWVVPREGYRISFQVSGGFDPYGFPAQAISGQRAQGLRAATTGPDASVFLVDEGRTGDATGLRGQLMRTSRAVLDGSFLVR